MVRALRHAQTRYQHRDIIRSPLGIRGTDEGATARLFVSLLGQYGFNTRVADIGRAHPYTAASDLRAERDMSGYRAVRDDPVQAPAK